MSADAADGRQSQSDSAGARDGQPSPSSSSASAVRPPGAAARKSLSSQKRAEQTLASRYVTQARRESLSRYGIGSSFVSRTSKRPRRDDPPPFDHIPLPKFTPRNSVPIVRLSEVILRSDKTAQRRYPWEKNDDAPIATTSSSQPPPAATNPDSVTSSAPVLPSSRRTTATRPAFVARERSQLKASPGPRSASFKRKSAESSNARQDSAAESREIPYLRSPSTLQRRTSGARSRKLSTPSPDVSLSPLVSDLSTAPTAGPAGLLPSNPEQGKLSVSISPVSSFSEKKTPKDDKNPYNSRSNQSDTAEAEAEATQTVATQIFVDAPKQDSATPLNTSAEVDRTATLATRDTAVLSSPAPHPAFQSSVGAGFASTVYASEMALVTNPLYPNTSTPQSPTAPSPKSPSQVLDDRGEAPHDSAVKTNSPQQNAADDLVQKRRLQVISTVEKARSRLIQLSKETLEERKDFRKLCCGKLRRWNFQRQHANVKGKGCKVMRLWLESLRSMETAYGSSMMVAFAFIRWVFLLNAAIAVMWTGAMIVPFMIWPPITFNWLIFLNRFITKEGAINILQGQWLDKTFVYYGGYTYQPWEQKKPYRVDYMYGVLIVATFLLSFVCVLYSIAKRIMNSGNTAMAARLYPLSALVFASWDFHITSTEAADHLRRGLRMHLKEMMSDTREQPKETQCMSAKRFTALFILWPVLMGGNVYGVYELVRKADIINQKIGSPYAQPLFFSLAGNIMPTLVRILVDMEDFRPATAERVVLSKLFCLRILSLATLFYRLYLMLDKTLHVRAGDVALQACGTKSTCSEGFTCCTKVGMTEWNICTLSDMGLCLPSCTENIVGAQLLRLITLTTIVRAVSEIAYGFGYVWTSSGKKRQLLIEDMAIDIVYIQALVWVGVCFSPMAAILGFFSTLLTWYSMRFALFRTCGPVAKAYSASRTSNMAHGLLLITLILATVPATITVVQKNSGFCGPIHEQVSMYTVIYRYIQKAPRALWIAISWIMNPAVLVGVIFFLVFFIVLVESRLVQTKQYLSLTKREIRSQRKETREKLNRVRKTLLHGSISAGGQRMSKAQIDMSPRSETSTLSEHLAPPSPLLPGQVNVHQS